MGCELEGVPKFGYPFGLPRIAQPPRQPSERCSLGRGQMDGTILQIGLFLAATFVAAVVTGVAGFAFGLVASGVWLHVLTPLQTATLIVGYGLVVQGYSVWKLRRNLDVSLLWPFLLGGALGVPVGVSILGWANPEHMRAGIGAVLIVYSVYSLLRPNLPPAKSAHALADGTAGSSTACSAA